MAEATKARMRECLSRLSYLGRGLPAGLWRAIRQHTLTEHRLNEPTASLTR